MPCLSVKSNESPSDDCSKVSARTLTTSVDPYLYVTRPSITGYMTWRSVDAGQKAGSRFAMSLRIRIFRMSGPLAPPVPPPPVPPLLSLPPHAARIAVAAGTESPSPTARRRN